MAVCQAMMCRLIYRYRSTGIYTTFFEVSHFLLWRAGLRQTLQVREST